VVHDEEELLAGHGVREMLQEQQRGVIGPVRIVEDDEKRAIPGQQPEQLIDRMQQPEPVVRRHGTVRLVRFGREQVGGEPRQLGGHPVTSHKVVQIHAIAHGAQYLQPRPVGRRPRGFRRPSPHAEGAGRLGYRGQFLRQPSLADPWLPAAEDQSR
jgi:hypothetical protein